MANIVLAQLKRSYGLSVWLLLTLLTAALLLYPVHLEPVYRPVQSPYIFDNFPLFASIYYAWIGILLFSLLLDRRRVSNRQKIPILLCIFSLVYLGFWTIITPYGRTADEFANLAQVNYLQYEHRIPAPAPPHYWYFEFPAVQTLHFCLSQVSGLGLFEVRDLLLVCTALLLTLLSYIFYMNLIKTSWVAALAVFVSIQGNIMLSGSNFLWPGNLGLILLMGLLVLMTRREDQPPALLTRALAMSVLIAAITVAYAPADVALLLILGSTYLVQKLTREKFVALSMFVLCLVISASWQVCSAVVSFEIGVTQSREAVEEILTWRLLTHYSTLSQLARSNVGEAVPLWASLTRVFWWVFLTGFGGILALRNLMKIKDLGSIDRRILAGVIGTAIFGIAISLATAGGAQLARFLLYGTFFLVPTIVRFFFASDAELGATASRALSRASDRGLHIPWSLGRRNAMILVVLVSLLFVSSLPSFLAHNGLVSTDAIYSYEVAYGEFLRSMYDRGDELEAFTGIADIAITLYYVGHSKIEPMFYPGRGMNETEVWQNLRHEIIHFKLVPRVRDTKILVYTPKFRPVYTHVWGIQPTHPMWNQLDEEISSLNLVYNSAYIQMYPSAAP